MVNLAGVGVTTTPNLGGGTARGGGGHRSGTASRQQIPKWGNQNQTYVVGGGEGGRCAAAMYTTKQAVLINNQTEGPVCTTRQVTSTMLTPGPTNVGSVVLGGNHVQMKAFTMFASYRGGTGACGGRRTVRTAAMRRSAAGTTPRQRAKAHLGGLPRARAAPGGIRCSRRMARACVGGWSSANRCARAMGRHKWGPKPGAI